MVKKDKSLLLAYTVLFIASLLIGGFSWWYRGLVPEGKNYPNPVVISMFLQSVWLGPGIIILSKRLRGTSIRKN